MNKIILVAVVLLISACAMTPKKEREWISPSGSVASVEELQKTKDKCEYDKKLDEASSLIGLAISVGRYESKYNTSTSDGHTRKAAKLMADAGNCMRNEGYKTRVKIGSKESNSTSTNRRAKGK